MILVLKYFAARTKTTVGPHLVNCNANGTL